jgi:hypothetical protein
MKLETSDDRSYWKPALTCGLALTACLMMHPARAQVPTIEELETRIEQAKKAKEANEQAQANSKRQPEQPQSAVASTQAQLLQGGTPQRLRDDTVAEPEKGRRKDPFDALADGLLRDHRTGLVWSASDNGRDVDWIDASRFCARRGMQLPTVGQLQKLIDQSGAMTTPCLGRQCKVSERFHLTGFGYWSRQREGDRWAIFVTLDSGRRSFDYVGIRNNFRALCVKGA